MTSGHQSFVLFYRLFAPFCLQPIVWSHHALKSSIEKLKWPNHSFHFSWILFGYMHKNSKGLARPSLPTIILVQAQFPTNCIQLLDIWRDSNADRYDGSYLHFLPQNIRIVTMGIKWKHVKLVLKDRKKVWANNSALEFSEIKQFMFKFGPTIKQET